MSIQSILPYVCQTRRFGHTYIHASIRASIDGWQGVEGTLNGERVIATYSSYGRSLQSGGHKYKAHVKYIATGKPVPSKLISSIH